VFVQISDPVTQGLVASLAKPGGNVTGFSLYDFSIGGKWLGLLKEIAPNLTRVAVMFNPETSPQSEFYVPAIEAAALSLGVQVTAIPVHATADIVPGLERFARQPNGGLILPTDSFTMLRGKLIADVAIRHRLPMMSANQGREHRSTQAGGWLRRPHSQGCQAPRSASTERGQIHARPQPKNRQGTRPYRPADVARARHRGDRMIRRREFITLLGGAAAWPLAARAQQGNRVRRIGGLMYSDENDPVWKTFVSAFTQALAGLGWSDGRNLRMDLRWPGPDISRIRALAQELVGLQPDIILTTGTPPTTALQRETRTIPIVFVNVSDPVASGIVERLDRPSENVTGFANFEATLGGKWVELLSEIAPGLKRAAIMFNPDTAPVSVYMPSLETAARSLKVLPIPAPVHSDVEIENAITDLGREPGGGLVVMPDVFFQAAHRASIISAPARNNVPAVYPVSYYARDGGLLSYGPDLVDPWRRAASYVDRILRGEKPGDLPVQFPTKFEMAVNRKTATALGLAIPPSILLRADEVID
jgi:putative ABC transport system substrate-binding protein